GDRAPPALARDLLPPPRGVRPPQKGHPRVAKRNAKAASEAGFTPAEQSGGSGGCAASTPQLNVRSARSVLERRPAFEWRPRAPVIDSQRLARDATRRRVAPELPMSVGSRSLLEVSR